MVEQRTRKTVSKPDLYSAFIFNEGFYILYHLKRFYWLLEFLSSLVNVVVRYSFLLNFVKFGFLNVMDGKKRGLLAEVIDRLGLGSLLANTDERLDGIFRRLDVGRLLNDLVDELLLGPEVSGRTAELARSAFPL